MDKFYKAIGGTITVTLLMMSLAPLSVLFGMWGGWLTEWLFPETMHRVMVHLQMGELKLWEIGGFMGFMGNFLRTKVEHK